LEKNDHDIRRINFVYREFKRKTSAEGRVRFKVEMRGNILEETLTVQVCQYLGGGGAARREERRERKGEYRGRRVARPGRIYCGATPFLPHFDMLAFKFS